MPLSKDILKTSLQEFADQLSSVFKGFPLNTKDNASKWADAIQKYAGAPKPTPSNPSPISQVIPPSTTSFVARQALFNVLNEVEDPLVEFIEPLPFTSYYISPESRMRLFIEFLKKAGYKSTPGLDKSRNFKILERVRGIYNKTNPIFALSDNDIYYNQARFNQIYAVEIAEGKKFNLLPDGVTVDSTGLNSKYRNIPVNSQGVIVPLQVDGIIGDDTIRYVPNPPTIVIYENITGNWNNTYSKIPFFTQPSTYGEVWIAQPTKDANGNYRVQENRFKIAPGQFKKQFSDKGLAKDYSSILIEQTQSQRDGNLSRRKEVETVDSFIKIFEANHASCDRVWLDSDPKLPKRGYKINTIEEYITFLKSKKLLLATKPAVQKNFITALETGIEYYIQILALGMNPNFTGNPSPNNLSFKPVISKGKAGASNEECINLMVDLIHTQFITSTATNNSSGITSPWS